MSSKPIIATITRREWLHLVWVAGVTVLAAKLLAVVYAFARPGVREGQFGGLFKIGQASTLPLVNTAPVNYPQGKFWLMRTEAGLLALHKVCPHLDCLFNWDEQEGKFVCPCHGSLFDRDGAHLSGPSPRNLDRFVVQVTSPDGQVMAETDPVSGMPLPIEEGVAAASLTEVDLPATDELLVVVDTGRKILGGQSVR